MADSYHSHRVLVGTKYKKQTTGNEPSFILVLAGMTDLNKYEVQ